MIDLLCPNPMCGNTYHFDDDEAGKRLRCKCGQTFRVEAANPFAGEPTIRRAGGRARHGDPFYDVVLTTGGYLLGTLGILAFASGLHVVLGYHLAYGLTRGQWMFWLVTLGIGLTFTWTIAALLFLFRDIGRDVRRHGR